MKERKRNSLPPPRRWGRKARVLLAAAGVLGSLGTLGTLGTVGTLGTLGILGALGTPAPLAAEPSSISGDYLEARTADIYTGPCFANSEVNLVGKEAVLAWHVRQGGWQGVPLAGLSVVAALRAAATLGDPFADPLPAHAVLLVDERASAAQREALVGFAHEMAGRLLGEVVRVESAPIELSLDPAAAAAAGHDEHTMHHAGMGAATGAAALSGGATLTAGKWIELRTRGLAMNDQLCGNEEVYYPPLTAAAATVPAVTLVHAWRGPGLGKTWSSPAKRSAFVGRFEH
jgi:hypothetical protein